MMRQQTIFSSWGRRISQRTMGRRDKHMCGPLIDWNGNGQIDPSDIAVTLAAAEEAETDDEDEQE